MKITGVKTLFADGGHRVFVFVKVETDQPGLVGWGEASLEAKRAPWPAVSPIWSR